MAPEPAASRPAVAPAPAGAAGEAAMTRPVRAREPLAGGEEDRVRDGGLPVCERDAGTRLHRPDRRPGPADRRDGRSAAGAGAPTADLGILKCTQMSFTLGALTLEQAKHLAGADAGALAGLTSLPSLRTWRQRLGELADRCDPLALQRRLASQMLAIEPAESQVYLADDHLAEYTGHQGVALGRNPRRGKPTKGHDDTYICDLAGRAIAFTTGEPSALCTTLPGALAALTDALPARDRPGAARRPLIVFDRGAAFGSAFTEVDAAGYDWLTWRRAPLAATTLPPITQTITLRGHRKRQVRRSSADSQEPSRTRPRTSP